MVLDFLQKAVASLQPKATVDFPGLGKLAKQALSRLQVQDIATEMGSEQALDPELINQLATLQVELKSAADDPRVTDRAALEALCVPLFARIHSVLARPRAAAELRALQDDLYALCKHLTLMESRSRARTRWLRGAALLIAAGPIAGYALHWGITSYWAIALVDSVDVIYPDVRLVRDTGGYYRSDYDLMPDTVKAFEEYYFRATRNQPDPGTDRPSSRGFLRAIEQARIDDDVPLPTAYDAAVAQDWGVPPGEKSNLFVYRVFLKNLERSKLVSKIGVSVQRTGDSRFFWDRLDVSTELEIYPQQNHFTVITTRAPVKDVVFDIAPVTLFGDAITPAAEGESQIVTASDIYPAFGEYNALETSEFPLYYRYARASAPAAAMREAVEQRLPEIDESEPGTVYRAFDALERATRAQPLVRLDCRGDDTVLFVVSDAQALDLVTRVERVSSLSVGIDYTLLDGRRLSTEETLDFATPFTFPETTGRMEEDAILDCIAPGVSTLAAAPDFIESGSNSVIASLAALAGALNPDLQLTDGSLVIEATFHLDMADTTSITQFQRDFAVMEMGDFAAFNVVLTDYPSGIYEFEFLFNDEVAGSLRLDPLWPQSLRYKPEDASLFVEP